MARTSGYVVVLTLGLTVVTPSLLGWEQDVRLASPARSDSEAMSTFVFKELALSDRNENTALPQHYPR